MWLSLREVFDDGGSSNGSLWGFSTADPGWRPKPLKAVLAEDGERAVLELADRLRHAGAGSSSVLYAKCISEMRAGALPFERVTIVFRHACFHAGVIRPAHRDRLRVCPECEALLEVGDDR